ncbi:EF-hand domain-containing protein [Sphingomonas sp. PAMC 26605]|uniref:EF-hand domain-containing protein n=1 Tax=Sphingomonas sp. PAMC 26605 TaxID=1112214 RepID=UPI00026CD1F9|nr:signal transduction protein [Sphingomonas sp. PAMC 26605]
MTSKIQSLPIIAVLLAFAPMAACASPAAPASGKNMTLEQFQARHEKKLLAADNDGDGRVSRAEFVAAAKAGKGDPAKRFARLDRNSDGTLDRAEIDAMLARRFKRMDTNGDGVISPQERVAAHAGKDTGKSAARSDT